MGVSRPFLLPPFLPIPAQPPPLPATDAIVAILQQQFLLCRPRCLAVTLAKVDRFEWAEQQTGSRACPGFPGNVQNARIPKIRASFVHILGIHAHKNNFKRLLICKPDIKSHECDFKDCVYSVHSVQCLCTVSIL